MSPEESPEEPFAPKIVKKLPEKTVSQDKTMVKFEVKVIGYPKPEAKWFKQGEEIIPSDEFQIENTDDGTSILVINEIYPDDTGEIKFEAFNSVGVTETVTQFFVEGKNYIPSLYRIYFSTFFNLGEFFSARNQKICSKNISPSIHFHENLLMFRVYNFVF
jgi:Immunoglobulin I-set domain